MPKIIKKNLIFSLFILILMIGTISLPIFYVWADNNGNSADEEINKLYDQISIKKKEIGDINSKISKYKSDIRAKQKQKSTLKLQVSILDDQVAATELEIKKINTQINQVNLEIEVNKKNILKTSKDIEKVRKQMAEFIRTMNRKDDKTYLEVVALNGTLSDFFDELSYLSNLETDLKISLDKLKGLKQDLDKERLSLTNREKNLADIKEKLSEEKEKLISEQNAKYYLLEQTRKDEIRYQNLLSQERALQNKINNEIAYLEKTVREKMTETGSLGDISKSGLIWPVPSKHITTYFHDPDYPYRNIFEHPAIDIRAGQGTPVKAAASGYVARAKNAGMGYSYIMLIHDKGLSTVYGHVSKILVAEDTYVVQGQTIALSGGMPGTPGAGRLTTGPHLHFEVRQNGIPVNPLNYLSY